MASLLAITIGRVWRGSWRF